jgi:hypothetical protein
MYNVQNSLFLRSHTLVSRCVLALERTLGTQIYQGGIGIHNLEHDRAIDQDLKNGTSQIGVKVASKIQTRRFRIGKCKWTIRLYPFQQEQT